MTIGLADAQRARAAIAGHVLRTPLVSSHSLGDRIGAEAFLKLENLQRTGSFKVRGAVYAMSRLSPAAPAPGVGTTSAGGAAQALPCRRPAGGSRDSEHGRGWPCGAIRGRAEPRHHPARRR